MNQGHSANPGYESGNYWMVCDRCGFDYRRSNMKEEWNNLWVCKECWEPRHPQDKLRSKKDKQSVQDARPPKTPVFLSAGDVTSDDL